MAKKNVTVIGMGDRVTGVKKDTGTRFDFRRVAFAFVNQYGSNDVSINNVDGDTLDELNVQVGCVYLASVQPNPSNKSYYIDLIKAL
jgi:hypothetical protein